MSEKSTRVCKGAGSPFPFREEGARGRGRGGTGEGEGKDRGGGEGQGRGGRWPAARSPGRSDPGGQPLAGSAPATSFPPWARRAAQAGSPGTRQAQAGRPDWGPSQQAASGSRSEADDVFASGSAGAEPGWAGDVTTRSRDRHSNKQLPSPCAAAPPRPAPPPERPHINTFPQAELAAKDAGL